MKEILEYKSKDFSVVATIYDLGYEGKISRQYELEVETDYGIRSYHNNDLGALKIMAMGATGNN